MLPSQGTFAPQSFRAPRTINARLLEKLPIQSDHYYGTEGSCCFLDPPGYPTYYLRSVYNRQGNQPDRAPSAVMFDEFGNARVVIGWHDCHSKDSTQKLLRDLYVPLPYNHPRVQAWISYVYAYFRNMYRDPAAPDNNVSNLFSYPNRPIMMHDGVGNKWEWSENKNLPYMYGNNANRAKQYKAWIAKRKAAGKQNGILKARIAEIVADSDNYRAGQVIREFYPEHRTRLDYITNPPAWGAGGSGDWWERSEQTVTPETCPRSSKGSTVGHEPFVPTGKNVSCWCQYCGWVNPWYDGKPEEKAEGEAAE